MVAFTHLMKLLSVAVVLLGCLFYTASASAGDRDVGFAGCMHSGMVNVCIPHKAGTMDHLEFSYVWPCDEVMKYDCMHQHNAKRQAYNQPTLKYYGKWPFIAVWGMQELFSCVFSVLNLVPHVHSFFIYKRKTAQSKYPFKKLWLAASLMSIQCWVWSAAFHGKESYATERLDYYGSIVNVCFFAAVSVLTSFNITNSATQMKFMTVACLLIAAHISYLQFVKFDYGWNMKVLVVVAVVQTGSWIKWWLQQRAVKPHAYKMVLFNGLLLSFGILEIFDFPPIAGLLDAHAIWHGLTAPLGYLLYNFLYAEARFFDEKGLSKGR